MAKRDEFVFPVIQPSSKVSTDFFFFSFCSVVLFGGFFLMKDCKKFLHLLLRDTSKGEKEGVVCR